MSLISVADLAARLNDPNLKILDARFALNDVLQGLADYLQSHLSGAQYVDLNKDLSDPKTDPLQGRHPLPSEAAFRAMLARSGIAPQNDVVIYDYSDGAMAASRCWFLLRLAEHKNVMVLDGGMNAWLADGLPVTEVIQTPVVSHYPVHFNQAMLVQVDELKDLLLNQADTVLLDARAPERYRGDVEPLDKKAGHIPGAVNRPFNQNLQDSKFKSPEQLRAEFAPLISGKRHILLSCGSGVTACHNALALSHAGIENYRLFAPSWSGWVADDENLIALCD